MDSESRDVERVLIGVAYLVISTALLLIYVAVLIAISKNGRLRNLSSFRLMMGLGVFHCIPLSTECLTGVLLVFDLSISNTRAEQIMGAIAASSFKCSVLMNMVLAANRFQILCCASKGNHTNRLFIGMILIVMSSFYVFFFVMDMQPGEGQYLDYIKYQWYYRVSPQFPILKSIKTYVQLSCLAASGSIYVIIAIFLIYNKVSLPQAAKPSVVEFRILLQCVLLNCCDALAILFYNYGIRYVHNRFDGVIGNSVYILINGINSVLYIMFVRVIRISVIKTVIGSKRSVVVRQLQTK
ncbi:hypothetical protein QR680_010073 [Steinernema hermaphroditum]|uniref:7TM GPCR serpentine receptor class x (Srx) domain-containing protein n=1 Tax=Steinernema hermaphroditum TaxID=289476 RepID=A0AA39INW0_9BILA|nr:hypothetical protein QR680_010073 [Steinernema hermaphroditum]